jgi:hypothetical protein
VQQWEQKRRVPDGPASLLLRVIADNPEAVECVVRNRESRATGAHGSKTEVYEQMLNEENIEDERDRRIIAAREEQPLRGAELHDAIEADLKEAGLL